MDVLNSMFTKACSLGLLQPLANRNAEQRISLYADDVALFIRPIEEEMNLTIRLLERFGDATGLYNNMQKSNAFPIRCEQAELVRIEQTLPCATADFPSVYLGLPITNKRFCKADLLPWIEKLGDKLPGWKASLMNLAGKVTWVRFVLTAIPIYVLIVIDMPKWFIKALNKLRRGFTWKGCEQLNGGACLVAWEKVQRPLNLGGLGILNLEYMGWALQMRWLWFAKTNANRPWQGLEFKFHPNVVAFFNMATTSQVGNGNTTCFWLDR